MRLKRALVVALALMVVAPSIVSPASAWLWPIFGFHDYCTALGYPIKNKTLPGTPQWPFFPDSGRAELVPPGVAFCPVNGNIGFGPVPPLLGELHAHPGPGEKTIAENESSVLKKARPVTDTLI